MSRSVVSALGSRAGDWRIVTGAASSRCQNPHG